MKLWTSLALLAGIIIVMGLIAHGLWRTEQEFQSEITVVGVEPPTLLAGFAARPSLEGRPYYGAAEAPLTLVVVTDFQSPAARSFHERYLPALKDEYMHTGKMRYYLKFHLVLEDVQERTDAYHFAQALACVHETAPGHYAAVQDWLFTASPEELLNIPERFAVPGESFLRCIDGPPHPHVLVDMAETERFGSVGIRPRLYVGVEGASNTPLDGLPSYTRLQRTIRDYETQIGD